MKTTLQALGIGLLFQWVLFTAFVLTGYRDLFLEHGGFWMSWVAASLVLAASFTAIRISVELTRKRLKAATTAKAYYLAVLLLCALCLLASFLSIITSTALFDIQGDRRLLLPDIGLITNFVCVVGLHLGYQQWLVGHLLLSTPLPKESAQGMWNNDGALPEKSCRPHHSDCQEKQPGKHNSNNNK
ncbi:hypothetical protein [Pseudomonas sp. PA15(2017)]|uniref:hypothetical protein n=1 Tax=Pseudomonas sp. PA15(2017) TaxID=1932111 RepID=UPI00117A10DD|nr:hypothetical protein [Pseudomonas sp. PA15(2017)]